MRDLSRPSPLSVAASAPHRRAAAAALALFAAPLSAARADSPFATRVVDFSPAPGQFVQHPAFSDPARALGPPVGAAPGVADNSKAVSLGGFGGSITLGFDHPIANQPPSAANPRGLDLIIFGNAFYVAADPARRWAEPGVIQVARDANGNGLADDPWFVIRGSHTPAIPNSAHAAATWDSDTADSTYPPALASWVPPARTGVWTTAAFALADPVFSAVVLVNPAEAGATESVWGYADCTPTMLLGDLDGDGVADEPGAAPAEFFVRPDDPLVVGISPGSAGGDAIDLDWAVDPATGIPAGLQAIDFVRITSAVSAVSPIFGERSTEISAAAEVRIGAPADPRDFNGDGSVDPDDLSDFITAFFAADPRADVNRDGALDPDDLSDFITAFFA